MNILDVLKRLERAGSEDSKAIQKLHYAAAEVARVIEKTVPVEHDLPRGYRVVQKDFDAFFLVCRKSDREYWIDGRYPDDDLPRGVPVQTREGSLQFAEDVATGLLDEIAAWLEQRSKESDAAAATLTEALF